MSKPHRTGASAAVCSPRQTYNAAAHTGRRGLHPISRSTVPVVFTRTFQGLLKQGSGRATTHRPSRAFRHAARTTLMAESENDGCLEHHGCFHE
jgi:hypothetical protein